MLVVVEQLLLLTHVHSDHLMEDLNLQINLLVKSNEEMAENTPLNNVKMEEQPLVMVEMQAVWLRILMLEVEEPLLLLTLDKSVILDINLALTKTHVNLYVEMD